MHHPRRIRFGARNRVAIRSSTKFCRDARPTDRIAPYFALPLARPSHHSRSRFLNPPRLRASGSTPPLFYCPSGITPHKSLPSSPTPGLSQDAIDPQHCGKPRQRRRPPQLNPRQTERRRREFGRRSVMNLKNMGSSDGKDGRPPALLPLVRQPSVYSLTFDEFQSTLGGVGKDFGSMNMDELLKNIWTAEESQAMAAALGGAGGVAAAGLDSSAASVGLQRQGSLTLPRTLSQKTVDEVWKDLIRENGQASNSGTNLHQQRQPTLGEMTLEEFLVRAGVVREDMTLAAGPRPIGNSSGTNNNANSNVFYGELPNSNNNTGLALGFPQASRGNGTVGANTMTNASGANLAIPATGTRPYAAPLPLGNAADLGNSQGMRGGGIVGLGDQGVNNGLMPGVVGLGGGGVTVAAVGSPANQLSTNGLGKGGDLSSLSPVPYVLGGGFRGRKCSGTVEKVVERRQRRMIKNRESAARSRARKQAYTMELEAEVAKLKAQNQELQKKQAEIMEMQKNQVLEIINQQHGPKKRCLRRTLTGPW